MCRNATSAQSGAALIDAAPDRPDGTDRPDSPDGDRPQGPPLPGPDASPFEIHRHLLEHAALEAWNHHRLLALIRRMDAGHGYRELGCASLVQYVELYCGINGLAARERVRVALALVDLPAIDRALERGELSYSKVRAITRAASPETEREWLDAARRHSAQQIEIMVARSNRGGLPRRRCVTRPLDRHTTRMTLELPTEEMELVTRALDAIRKDAGGQLASSQAMVYMAADSLAGRPGTSSSAERYTVIVHAGSDGTAWMENEYGDAPLRPSVVERLLCDCAFRLAREEADGTCTLSKRQRTLPAITRRSIEIRDRMRCRVPGCHNHLWVDVHHIKDRLHGGRNVRDNLCLLCNVHHAMVHDGILLIEHDADGELVFLTRDGRMLGDARGEIPDATWRWLEAMATGGRIAEAAEREEVEREEAEREEAEREAECEEHVVLEERALAANDPATDETTDHVADAPHRDASPGAASYIRDRAAPSPVCQPGPRHEPAARADRSRHVSAGTSRGGRWQQRAAAGLQSPAGGWRRPAHVSAETPRAPP
jgi:hypothetical protein